MSDDRPVNRRHFFRHGLGELLRPLAQIAKPLEEAIRQIGSMDLEMEAAKKKAQQPAPPPASGPTIRAAPGIWLRPPGALHEQAFRDTCSRCGQCVQVCPAQCIKIDSFAAKGAGVPYIEPNDAACVLCDGLQCMHHCPSGALIPTPIQDIYMGTAQWHESSCLRSKGENCTICIDQCPVGEMALVLDGNRVRVIESGCAGCGLCQHSCPTEPKSITVVPRGGAGPVSRGRGG